MSAPAWPVAARAVIALVAQSMSALEPVMADEVLDVMNDLAKAGQTMLIVTHSMGFAHTDATEAHLFAEGRDVEHAPPERFFGALGSDATKAFLKRVAH